MKKILTFFKNNFFILHTFVMVGVAYFLENYQGWRVALFSKNMSIAFVDTTGSCTTPFL